jgi:hypothetical protein
LLRFARNDGKGLNCYVNLRKKILCQICKVYFQSLPKEVVKNKVDKSGAGFFSADKAQNVAVLVVRRGFATQSGVKKTNQMSNLFLTAS